MGRKIEIDHARLHDGDAVFGVNFKDARHPSKRHHDAALRRHRAAAQPRARAARDDRDAVFGSHLHATRHLVSPVRQRHHSRHPPINRAIVLEHDQILRLVDDVLIPHNRPKLSRNRAHIRIHAINPQHMVADGVTSGNILEFEKNLWARSFHFERAWYRQSP